MGRLAVDGRPASLVAQWTVAVHVVALVMLATLIACFISCQETPHEDSERSAAARRSAVSFLLAGLVLQVLLCVFLAAAAQLAAWGRKCWELVSLISMSTSVAMMLWLGPGSVSCLFDLQQAAFAGEQNGIGLAAAVILGLAHATCVPVTLRWSWVVPISSWCSFAALVGLGGFRAPLMLPWKILALLLLLLVSLGGAWSREQLLRAVQTQVSECRCDEAGDESTCEAGALEHTIGIKTKGSKAEEAEDEEEDKAWPDCPAILPESRSHSGELSGSRSHTDEQEVVEEEKAWPDCTAILPGSNNHPGELEVVEEDKAWSVCTAILPASRNYSGRFQGVQEDRATDSQQYVGGEGAWESEATSVTKSASSSSMGGCRRSLSMSMARAADGMPTRSRFPFHSMDSSISFNLTRSEMDPFEGGVAASTQTEGAMTTEHDFEEIFRSLGVQAPTAKVEPGTCPDLALVIAALHKEVEKASACTQTERESADTCDASENTSIQWSEHGFKCGACARPPKLPGPPTPNKRRRTRRRQKPSDDSNGDASRSTDSTDAVDAQYEGGAFDGDWVIVDDMAKSVSAWLRCLSIRGSHVFLGDGSTESIVMNQGRAMLDQGVLELSDGQLYRVGKSGRLAVFNRGEEVLDIEERILQSGASDADDDDDVESLMSFVMA